MYTGWIRRFEKDRLLNEGEIGAKLLRSPAEGVEPDQRMGLIRINSIYMDWIDRRFLYRGMMGTSVITGGFIFFAGMLAWLIFGYVGRMIIIGLAILCQCQFHLYSFNFLL